MPGDQPMMQELGPIVDGLGIGPPAPEVEIPEVPRIGFEVGRHAGRDDDLDAPEAALVCQLLPIAAIAPGDRRVAHLDLRHTV